MAIEDVDWPEARRLFEVEGRSYREIAQQFGVVHNTIRTRAIAEGWARQDSAAAARDAERRANAEAAAARTKLKWEQRRGDEADATGVAASRMRQHVLDAADKDDWHMVRSASIAYGIFIDKAQLLTGGATSRPAAPDEIDAHTRRLGQLRDELAERRDRTA